MNRKKYVLIIILIVFVLVLFFVAKFANPSRKIMVRFGQGFVKEEYYKKEEYQKWADKYYRPMFRPEFSYDLLDDDVVCAYVVQIDCQEESMQKVIRLLKKADIDIITDYPYCMYNNEYAWEDLEDESKMVLGICAVAIKNSERQDVIHKLERMKPIDGHYIYFIQAYLPDADEPVLVTVK